MYKGFALGLETQYTKDLGKDRASGLDRVKRNPETRIP